MFARKWSALPEEVFFPSNLKDLGYFMNDQDEIRSIENPDCYFRFHLNKNTRINDRQRKAFNAALEDVIHRRIEKLGLTKQRLPPGTLPTEPHVPIFASSDLGSKSRVVVVFGESTQGLGVLAGRVTNGPGGLDKGTMVSVIKGLSEQASTPHDESPPGIVLANMGQRYWAPQEGRAISIMEAPSLSLPSLVHHGIAYDPELNDIPGHRSVDEHIKSIFQEITRQTKADAVLDVIAIGESCEFIETFFDNQDNWAAWGGRLSAMLHFGSVYSTERLENAAFKNLLAKRTRGYIISPYKIVDIPLASPEGNPNENIPTLGCPTYSSSVGDYTELIFIAARESALNYLETVAMTPDFENEVIIVAVRPPEEDKAEEEVPEESQSWPSMSKIDQKSMKKQMRNMLAWEKFEKTGVAPPEYDSDSSEEEDTGPPVDYTKLRWPEPEEEKNQGMPTA